MKKIQKLLRDYQKLFIWGLVVTIGGLLLFIVLIPASRRTIELYQSLGRQKLLLKNLREKLLFLEGLDETKLKQDYNELLAAVPQDKAIPQLLMTVDKLGGQTGIALNDLNFTGGSMSTDSARNVSKEEQTLGANLLAFNFNIAGDLEQITNFLTTTNQVRRLLRLKNFSVTFPENGVGKAIINADTFYNLPVSKRKQAESLVALTLEEEELFAQITALPNLSEVIVLPIPSEQPGEIPLAPVKSDPFSL